MSLNLLENVGSRQDAKGLILELQNYAKWHAQTARKMQITGDKSYEAPVLSPTAVSLIKQCVGNEAVSDQALDGLIKALVDFASTAPYMVVTLAAPPPAKLKQDILAWCRSNIKPNILVDFKFNSTMLGGMVVVYGSHVFDWSFKRQILTNRQKFPEVLRHV